MAVNDLSKVIPQLLAQGLMALREFAIMPQLVNRQYESMAGREGSTIDVPIPSVIAVQNVTPANTPPSTEGVTPTSVPIPLNRWKEAPFYLTDKDLLEVQRGTIPMQASEAIKALANEVDVFLLGLTKKFYGVVGAPGVLPFGSASPTTATAADATEIRKVLNKQLAALTDRRVVLGPDAEAAALNLRAFQDASWSGSTAAILAGSLNTKFGMQWFMDQNIQANVHTAGTAKDYATTGTDAIGSKSITCGSGTGAFVIGDIVKFANHTQTYVVTTGGTTTFSIEPGLVATVPNGTLILGPADTGGYSTHTINPFFHRDAIAFATRPLQSSNHPNSVIASAVDEISGLTLRLEFTREYKRDRFSYDILYGAEVVRRELGGRYIH